ncbi:MAG: glycosyltransferase family 2 protein [Dorea longicatena]
MPFFTIFTPTYNRAYILPQLYQSLCMQTCKDFEWLIIDDGSKDNTYSLVEEWINKCKKFSIRYYAKRKCR